jgi:hypothetical protein
MKIQKKGTIVLKILKRMKELDSVEALLRADFADLGNPRQVTRGLNTLIKQKKLIKIGHGIYVRAYVSKYSDQPLIAAKSTTIVFLKALDRLGVKWELGSAIRAYNEGRTTQVPVYTIVKLKSRFRGKIGDGPRQVIFEDRINAR